MMNEQEKLENDWDKLLKEYDEELKIHDFRLVTAESYTNVIFDILIPFEKNYTEEELFKLLIDGFKDEKTKYYFVLSLDRPFY